VSGEGTLGPSLRLTFQCPRLAEQRFEAAASGPLDLPTLLALLPADLMRQLPQTTGQVEFNAKARYSPSQGLDIPAAEVRLHNLALRW
jgi:hypothetical protein